MRGGEEGGPPGGGGIGVGVVPNIGGDGVLPKGVCCGCAGWLAVPACWPIAAARLRS
jgi:hypothetical protein